MTQAARTAVRGLAGQASHAGLVLSRLLDSHEDGGEDQGKCKQKLVRDAAQASKNAKGLYSRAFERWVNETSGHAVGRFQTKGRLAVGLGNESPLEVGLTLHHTYGVPIVPGSAIKGVTRHYAAEVLGPRSPELQAVIATLFGSTDDCGHIGFEDAWIDPDSLTPPNSGLLPDVLTPHHPDYYTGSDPERKPTEFDSPNPVSFTSVAGIFFFAVKCDVQDETGTKWAQFALRLVERALADWGVGGKTRSGYGRFSRLDR